MAELSLKITARTEQASESFKTLAESSDYVKERIERLAKRLGEDHVERFVDKQKLAETALTATGRQTEALEQSVKNYQREIERLIKSGMDPASESIKKLAQEQQNLEERVKSATAAKKAQEDAVKALDAASKALWATLGAGIVALGAITQKSAEAGDEIAKTAKTIGTTAEALQELRYAAQMTGSSSATLDNSLQKLNKNMSDLQSGSGALRTHLNNNNRALLAQLGTVKSNEEAFKLLMKGIKEAPNEFERAALAQAAFGKSGQELINMAMEGADGIAKLREEKRKYGVISNEAAEQSEKYMDAQTRLKEAMGGVANELSKALMPGITNAMNSLADWISSIDNWPEILDRVKIALVSVGAGLTAFTLVSKKAIIIKSLTAAMHALKAAMTALMATPAGWAALAIGGLVAVMMSFNKTSDKSIENADEIAAKMQSQRDQTNSLIAAYEKLNPNKAIDEETTRRLISLYPQLTGKIEANITTLQELKELWEAEDQAAAHKEVSPMIQALNKKIAEYKMIMGLLEEVNETYFGTWEHSIYEGWRVTKEKEIKDHVTAINGILSGVGDGVTVDLDNYTSTVSKAAQTARQELIDEIKKANDFLEANISKRLSNIAHTQAQQAADNINQLKSFLNARADLEKKAGTARVQWLEAQRAVFAKYEKDGLLNESDVKQANAAINEAIKEIQDKANTLQERLAGIFPKIAIEREKDEYTNTILEALEKAADIEQLKGDERLEFYEKHKNELLEIYKDEAQKKLAIEAAYQTAAASVRAAAKAAEEAEQQAAIEQKNNLIRDRLATLLDTEAEADRARQSQFTQFLNERMEAEQVAMEDRLEFIRQHQKDVLALFDEHSEEYESANKALQKALKEEDERSSAARRAIMEQTASAFASVLGSMGSLIAAFGKDQRKAAIAQKVLGASEIAINTIIASVKALKEGGGVPYGIPPMLATIAAGVAQGAALAATNIPSAETGGRFVVPDVSPRIDGALLRVNQGEVAEITPRSETGTDNRAQIINLILDGQVFATFVNKRIRSGDINIRLGGNF